MTHRVVILIHEGFQLLDLAGPSEVFTAAAEEGGAAAYRVEVATVDGLPVRSSSRIEVRPATRLDDPARIDTLVIAGGNGIADALADRAFVGGVAAAAGRASRVASICTGAFALAEAGLLDGRRATTHWRSCELLAERYPDVTVESDRIHTRDGHIWTSAGVTAGIDLALAVVEIDHGRDLALRVARRLVVFLQRPGGQSQFSAPLRAQAAERAPLREVQAHIAAHPTDDLSVERLAARAGLSPRHFARAFAAETGLTPGRYVEQVRVETARRLLEDTPDGVEAIAVRAGFGTAETMRRAFLRTVGIAPTDHRRRFAAGPLKETA